MSSFFFSNVNFLSFKFSYFYYLYISLLLLKKPKFIQFTLSFQVKLLRISVLSSTFDSAIYYLLVITDQVNLTLLWVRLLMYTNIFYERIILSSVN